MVGNIGYWIFINAHSRRDALFEKDLKETVDKKRRKIVEVKRISFREKRIGELFLLGREKFCKKKEKGKGSIEYHYIIRRYFIEINNKTGD